MRRARRSRLATSTSTLEPKRKKSGSRFPHNFRAADTLFGPTLSAKLQRDAGSTARRAMLDLSKFRCSDEQAVCRDGSVHWRLRQEYAFFEKMNSRSCGPQPLEVQP